MNIFINYRRADSAYQADRLCQALSKYLQKPEKQLYMDIESTALGVDYIALIQKKIKQCDVMLTLIGEDWIAITNPETGEPRLQNPQDLVRCEIKTALNFDKPVVPTMFDNAPYLKAEQLPSDIKKLAYRNGISIKRETFDEDVLRLAEGLGLTNDNRKYGVFIASQAPLLAYIIADKLEENSNKSSEAVPRPPIFSSHVSRKKKAAIKPNTLFLAQKKSILKLAIGLLFVLLGVMIWQLLPTKAAIHIKAAHKAPIQTGSELSYDISIKNTGWKRLKNVSASIENVNWTQLTQLSTSENLPIHSSNPADIESLIPFHYEGCGMIKPWQSCQLPPLNFRLTPKLLQADKLKLKARIYADNLPAQKEYITAEIMPPQDRVALWVEHSPKTGLKIDDPLSYEISLKNNSDSPLSNVRLETTGHVRNQIFCERLSIGGSCKMENRITLTEGLIEQDWYQVPITASGDFTGAPLKEVFRVKVAEALVPAGRLQIRFDRQNARIGEIVTLRGSLTNSGETLIKSAKISISGGIQYLKQCGNIEDGKSCTFQHPIQLKEGDVSAGLFAVKATAKASNLFYPLRQKAQLNITKPLPARARLRLTSLPRQTLQIGGEARAQALLTNIGETTLKAAELIFKGPLEKRKSCGDVKSGESCTFSIDFELAQHMVKNNKLQIAVTGIGENLGAKLYEKIDLNIMPLEAKADLKMGFDQREAKIGEKVTLMAILVNSGDTPLRNGQITFQGPFEDQKNCAVIAAQERCSYEKEIKITDDMVRGGRVTLKATGEADNLEMPLIKISTIRKR